VPLEGEGGAARIFKIPKSISFFPFDVSKESDSNPPPLSQVDEASRLAASAQPSRILLSPAAAARVAAMIPTLPLPDGSIAAAAAADPLHCARVAHILKIRAAVDVRYRSSAAVQRVMRIMQSHALGGGSSAALVGVVEEDAKGVGRSSTGTPPPFEETAGTPFAGDSSSIPPELAAIAESPPPPRRADSAGLEMSVPTQKNPLPPRGRPMVGRLDFSALTGARSPVHLRRIHGNMTSLDAPSESDAPSMSHEEPPPLSLGPPAEEQTPKPPPKSPSSLHPPPPQSQSFPPSQEPPPPFPRDPVWADRALDVFEKVCVLKGEGVLAAQLRVCVDDAAAQDFRTLMDEVRHLARRLPVDDTSEGGGVISLGGGNFDGGVGQDDGSNVFESQEGEGGLNAVVAGCICGGGGAEGVGGSFAIAGLRAELAGLRHGASAPLSLLTNALKDLPFTEAILRCVLRNDSIAASLRFALVLPALCVLNLIEAILLLRRHDTPPPLAAANAAVTSTLLLAFVALAAASASRRTPQALKNNSPVVVSVALLLYVGATVLTDVAFLVREGRAGVNVATYVAWAVCALFSAASSMALRLRFVAAAPIAAAAIGAFAAAQLAFGRGGGPGAAPRTELWIAMTLQTLAVCLFS
jgi:hypothetical protein